MLIPKKKHDVWNNKESRYIQDKNNAGKGVIYGQLEQGGIIAKFSMTEQAKGEYLLRGTLTLISPATGKPLECEGAERKRRNHRRGRKNPPPPVASCNIHLKTMDQEEVKAHLEKKAKALIEANAAAIQHAFEKADIQTDQTLPGLVFRYGTSFLKSKDLKESTRESQKRMLHRAAAVFCLIPLAMLDEAAVIKVQTRNAPLASKEFHLLSNFWNYCQENHSGIPDNPFTNESRLSKGQKREGAKQARKRSTPNYLFPEQERTLDPEFLQLVETDPYGIVPILLKDAGLDITAIIELKWADIIFSPDEPLYVRIKISQKYAGWTSDYTRPVFYLAALALHILYDLHSESSSSKTRTEQYILPLKGKTSDRKKVTDYIRQCLFHLGVERSPLASAKKSNSKAVAGEQFLLNTYKHKVETQLGLELSDPAAVRFLLGKSLAGDVTADHYRSFTDDAGQYRLYIAMRRWGTSVERKTSRKVNKEEDRQNGNYRCTLKAEDAEKKIVSELEVTLRPGESLACRNNYGFEIDISPITDNDDPPPYIPYYDLQKVPDLYDLLSEATGEDRDTISAVLGPEH